MPLLYFYWFWDFVLQVSDLTGTGDCGGGVYRHSRIRDIVYLAYVFVFGGAYRLRGRSDDIDFRIASKNFYSSWELDQQSIQKGETR